MRDPKRIKELLILIQLIWVKNPDIRFNQLIHNLQCEYRGGEYVRKAYVDEIGWGTVDVSYPDLFNVEDDDFIDFLKAKI